MVNKIKKSMRKDSLQSNEKNSKKYKEILRFFSPLKNQISFQKAHFYKNCKKSFQLPVLQLIYGNGV